MRIITFSKFDEHSSPPFKQLKIIGIFDLITLHMAIFMYKFHNQFLPPIFHNLFIPVDKVHRYNTRLAAKKLYYLPSARTNYGHFNIRFQGTKVWNTIEEDIKCSSLKKFKLKLKNNLIAGYILVFPIAIS